MHDCYPIQPAITATRLHKSFGDQMVLDAIDLHVPEATIFSLLGPNGAGKTTMVQILSTLIGVTGQFSAVDDLLTGQENLILVADLHHPSRAEGRRRAVELLEQFDLVEAGKKTAGSYCGGMRRRLDLRWAWSATHASSSSTNRPPASTRAADVACGRSSATWSPAESRSS